MHYTNLQYVVKYLCDHYADEIDEINAHLSEFINNLNVRYLRPVIPDPAQMVSAKIMKLNRDGTVNIGSILAQDDEFLRKVEIFVRELSGEINEVTRKDVLDRLEVKKERIKKGDILEEVMMRIRPDVKVKKSLQYHFYILFPIWK